MVECHILISSKDVLPLQVLRHVAVAHRVLFDMEVVELHNRHGVRIHKRYHGGRVGGTRC